MYVPIRQRVQSSEKRLTDTLAATGPGRRDDDDELKCLIGECRNLPLRCPTPLLSSYVLLYI